MNSLSTTAAVYDPVRTPYEVDAGDFPLAGSLEDQFRFLLRYAILAPSTHNSQPWRFAVHENGVDVFADYGRRLPIVDPGHRELLMSVGAAVFTLRVAAGHFGFSCDVEYNHTGASDRPLAVAVLSPKRGAAGSPLDSLFPSIVRRRTNRHHFLVSRIPATALSALSGLDRNRAVSMTLSTDGALIQEIANAIGEAEEQLFADFGYRRDEAEWIRPDGTRSPDGIPGTVYGITEIPPVLASWAAKSLDASRSRAAMDKNLCREAPGLVVISGEDTVPHWLDAGELLQHVLLTAEREGLQCSYFNTPVQLPAGRARLRKMLGVSSWPQLLLRIGYCLEETPRTPRRPLEDVLMSPYTN